MRALGWLGLLLIALWLVAWLGFKLVSALVHLLLVVGVVLLAWALVKRGVRAIR